MTTSTFATSTVLLNLNNDSSIQVILLLILVSVALIDLVRRLFMPQKLY